MPGETLVVHCERELRARWCVSSQRAPGAEVESVRRWMPTAHVDLQNVLAELGRRECNDVLVEAGADARGRFLQLGLADELIVVHRADRARARSAGHGAAAAPESHRATSCVMRCTRHAAQSALMSGCLTLRYPYHSARSPRLQRCSQESFKAIGEVRAITPRGGDVEFVFATGSAPPRRTWRAGRQHQRERLLPHRDATHVRFLRRRRFARNAAGDDARCAGNRGSR